MARIYGYGLKSIQRHVTHPKHHALGCNMIMDDTTTVERLMSFSVQRRLPRPLPVRHVRRDDLGRLLWRMLPADGFDKVSFRICKLLA